MGSLVVEWVARLMGWSGMLTSPPSRCCRLKRRFQCRRLRNCRRIRVQLWHWTNRIKSILHPQPPQAWLVNSGNFWAQGMMHSLLAFHLAVSNPQRGSCSLELGCLISVWFKYLGERCIHLFHETLDSARLHFLRQQWLKTWDFQLQERIAASLRLISWKRHVCSPFCSSRNDSG